MRRGENVTLTKTFILQKFGTMETVLADLSLAANILMGLGFIIWLIGELIGIKVHNAKKDTTTEWLRAFRIKYGRAALAFGLTLLWLTLLLHTETSWP